MNKKLDEKKVAVGMSGGIDSSVAALLLKQQGYEVIGVTLKHLPDELSENPGKTCCSLDDINDARYTCYTLGIPHYVLNVVEEFKKDVMDYFIKMYNAGKTPSPCVICDEKVKIKKLVEFADKMGIKYISTGHYSKVSENNMLLWDKNNRKDQTYMLYRLDKDIVERFLFPLAEYEKSEVREIARQNGIHTHNKPDSQGICFAPNGYIPFLSISSIFSKIKKHMETHGIILEKIEEMLENVDLNEVYGERLSDFVKDEFEKFEKISIDFGVMEHTKSVSVIPVDIDWNDVGNFKSLEDIFPKDKDNNVVQADNFEQIESEGNIVINKENDKIIATIGLENIVIVNTKDALLVCHKDKSQEIKKILNKIEMKNK